MYEWIIRLRPHTSHQLGFAGVLSRVLNLCINQYFFSDIMHPISLVLLVSCLLPLTSVWMNHLSQATCIPSTRSCWCPVSCPQPLYEWIILLRQRASHQLGLVGVLSLVLNLCMNESSFSDLMHPISSVLLVSCGSFSTSIWTSISSLTSCIPSTRSCLFPVACSQPLYGWIIFLSQRASHHLGLVGVLSLVLDLYEWIIFLGLDGVLSRVLNLCINQYFFSDTMHPINSVLMVSCCVFSTSVWVNHHSQTSISVWVNLHFQTSCIPWIRSCWCPVACSQPLYEWSFLLRHQASHQLGLVGILSSVLNLCMNQSFFSESEHKRTDDEPKQPGAHRTQDQVQERHGQRPDVQFQVKNSQSTNW